jgi:hypothetical protein
MHSLLFHALSPGATITIHGTNKTVHDQELGMGRPLPDGLKVKWVLPWSARHTATPDELLEFLRTVEGLLVRAGHQGVAPHDLNHPR